MHLIHRERIQQFIEEHADSGSSLRAFVQNMEQNDFKNPVNLKQTFKSANYVKPHWVFDIAWNKYRLIALINFEAKIMSVEHVMTHKEYSKGKWRR